ncbi:MAG: DoxX family protein [Bacteroidota bacterium]
MNFVKNLGKWLFILPFAAFGFLHFEPIEFSLPYLPTWLPAPAFWVYLLGVCLFAFTVSAIIKKLDGLASVLLAILLLIFVFTIHIPKAISGDFLGVIATFRDTCMAGAALLYAVLMAKDLRGTGLSES